MRDLRIDVAARRLTGETSLHDKLAKLAGDQIAASSEAELTFNHSVDALIAAARENDLVPRAITNE